MCPLLKNWDLRKLSADIQNHLKDSSSEYNRIGYNILKILLCLKEEHVIRELIRYGSKIRKEKISIIHPKKSVGKGYP